MVSSNVRLLAGSHDEPRGAVAEGQLRADLYHAMARCELRLPPLRARRDDIAILAERFLYDAAQQHGKPVHGLAELQVLRDFFGYPALSARQGKRQRRQQLFV